ncbi:restriction endonuclease [Arthrospira platensis]|uniref:restriction endonuclease n=1 Tax=Limnospira TaxID=2596745 RepID=UPI0001C384D5|nr:restriction endonuclease [Arthrospira platensis]AMW30246.1 restriction endonuclease [Arthrospira platensis YZ]KDR56453.1 restriction endonuclease [Arthrospira platensis str. Paraca]MBD2670358.1 restriction endonuclease [Arthrospira platensis FACHB-439]MBD2710953.1 restriction endonuclease [Arthrospira platensis FACHB-835]MDT9185528.1 restriction endonuclease [Limnospira sp. PMC 289.06]MDT9313158.1 restriction endonuclease [Limnospira sp. Paracas R14]QQW28200.1 restriction endonuclease [Ar
MSFADAAIQVLEDVGSPLHYRKIAQIAIARNLIQTNGKSPEATLNAIIAVEIKQKGDLSRFVRVNRGVFGLRKWDVTSIDSESNSATLDPRNETRVKVSHFPTYSELRLILPIWNGRDRAQITGLRSAIMSLSGTLQNPVDWTNPERWISERLEGENRELAEAIWTGSDRQLNPRHVYGHWLLSRTYQLLEEDSGGKVLLTDAGQDFICHPLGEVEKQIDEGEGLLKLLSVVAEKGGGRRGDFVPDWSDYLKRCSQFGTDSTIKDTLWRRLYNLADRELLIKTGTTYSITDAGLNYLKDSGGDEELDGGGTVQEILTLVKEQKASVRSSIQEILSTMAPTAFEYLIKQLLEAMNYQNVEVTSPTNDKGVDVVADIELGITSVREVVQVKRQQGNIQRPVLDALRGCLYRFQAVRGTIITTSDFSKGTVEVAFAPGAPPITLINGEKLLDLLIEYGIGVKTKAIEVLELDADAFAQNDSYTSDLE